MEENEMAFLTRLGNEQPAPSQSIASTRAPSGSVADLDIGMK